MALIDKNFLLNYNVPKYINSLGRKRQMTIEGLLSRFMTCKTYSISEEVSPYLYYIEQEPLYVPSKITDIKTDLRISTLNPKFILFSAPGATGKTALAKFVAYTKNAIYWDLAKLKLGTNSFDGTILRGVGSKNYSCFINDLDNSRVLLVIDALDEADIISGRKMLSGFISDIDRAISGQNTPSVFLLARAETAQYIAAYCADNSIALSHYEIGFFNEKQAKDFIYKSIQVEKKAMTPADTECINAYYDAVQRNISEKERLSFLGYAPVLQAMAKRIKDTRNQVNLINELKDKTDCVSIISSIMESLLRREHIDKFVNAFKEKCKEQHTEFQKWDFVYTEEEQLVRIINYILFEEIKYEEYPVPELPSQLIDDYLEMLNTFLPQHPFLRCLFDEKSKQNSIDFTGPAFRDYTLARLILDEDKSVMVDCYYEMKNLSHSPSQIFFDCYRLMSNGTVRSKHLPYVYDSYRAKATAMESTYIQCASITGNNDSENNHVAIFGLSGPNGQYSKNEVDFELVIDDHSLQFNQMMNVVIDEPELTVQIGSHGKESRITNSTIISKTIEWKSDDVIIEAFDSQKCLFVASEGFKGEIPSFDLIDKGEIKVSTPNIHQYYRLIPFKYDFDDTTSIDITKFIHGMRAILIEFRAHKKDTLAKSSERIDYVVVGKSKLKQNILKYFKECGIIYEAPPLYKVDEGKMQLKGIYFSGLASNDSNSLLPFYNEYNEWLNNSSSKAN